MTIEQSMVAALARHERAVQTVAEITSQIGKALQQCPVSVAVSQSVFTDGDVDELYDARYRVKTHLWHALSGRGQDWLDDEEVIEYLADDETGCPHCAQAFDLILQRKQARQELGAARRLIRHYGKRAMALQAGDA